MTRGIFSFAEIPVRGKENSRIARVVFVVSALLFCLTLFAVVAGPLILGNSVVGPSDSYFYMAKGEQLLRCPQQDCAALNDLRMQTQDLDPDSYAVNASRRTIVQRVFYMYHMVHSAALAVLHVAGLTWETAFHILSFIGIIVIAFGIISFLYSLWGAGPAGLGLAVLLFEVYPGYHGIHWVLPSNMALGIGFCLWAAILLRPKWIDVALPIIVLLLVWLHPIGRAHAGVGMALYFMTMSWRQRRGWIVLMLAGLAWISPSSAPLLISRPLLHFEFATPEEWNFWIGFLENATAAWDVLADYYGNLSGTLLLMAAALGVLVTPPGRRRPVIIMAGLLIAMAGVSLLHMLPGYPGELFRRLVIPIMVFIGGAFGQFAWGATAQILNTQRMRHGGVGRTVAAAIALLVCLFLLVNQAATGWPTLRQKAGEMISWARMPIDTAQPGRILSMLEPGERLLYMHELSLYVYLTRGGLDRGAVFYPAVKDTPLEAKWVNDAAHIRFVVAPIPRFYGTIQLSKDATIMMTFDAPVRSDEILLRITNPLSRQIVLAADGFHSITIPGRSDQWLALKPIADITSLRGVTLKVTRGGFSWISGVRLSQQAQTNWPWRLGMTVSRKAPDLRKPDEPQTVEEARFALDTPVPEQCTLLDVVEDSSTLAVFRVDCAP